MSPEGSGGGQEPVGGERAGGGAETQAGEPWGAGDGCSKLSGAGAVTDFRGRSPSQGPSLRHLVRSPGREMGRECCLPGQEPARWLVSAGALGAPPRDGLGPPGGPARPGRSPRAQPAVLRQPFRSWARGPHPLAAGAANPQRKSNISPGTAQPYISPPGPPRYSRRGRWTRTEPGPQPRDHQPRGSQAAGHQVRRGEPPPPALPPGIPGNGHSQQSLLTATATSLLPARPCPAPLLPQSRAQPPGTGTSRESLSWGTGQGSPACLLGAAGDPPSRPVSTLPHPHRPLVPAVVPALPQACSMCDQPAPPDAYTTTCLSSRRSSPSIHVPRDPRGHAPVTPHVYVQLAQPLVRRWVPTAEPTSQVLTYMLHAHTHRARPPPALHPHPLAPRHPPARPSPAPPPAAPAP